jgi:hypothetical protein
MAATVGRLAVSAESRVRGAESFLSIIEQNTPQFFVQSERRPKKIIYLKFPPTDANLPAIHVADGRIADSRSLPDCDNAFAVGRGKKAFTIPGESAVGSCIGSAARSMTAPRRARP